MKDSTISVRIDKELKEQAESIFKELGISVSTAFTLFYKQVVLNNGIPFELSLQKRPKALDEYTKEELVARFEEGFRQAERGEVYTVDEVFDRLLTRTEK